MKNSDKRDEILRAALELIAEHGFHGAPMAMVAERAGVGAGTIYRYFEGKDALIAEIFAELEKNSSNTCCRATPSTDRFGSGSSTSPA